jgi:hypothetical protein
MKQVIMFLGIGFVAFQFLLVIALMAAAKRPTPRFAPEIEKGREIEAPEILACDALELAVH